MTESTVDNPLLRPTPYPRFDEIEVAHVEPAMQTVLAELDETIRVPLHTGVESLSVGAAAAVVLFEAARQRRGSR